MSNLDIDDVAAGRAALSLCESMLLALVDLKVITEKNFDDIVRDAANVHHDAADLTKNAGVHRKIAAIILAVRPGIKLDQDDR